MKLVIKKAGEYRVPKCHHLCLECYIDNEINHSWGNKIHREIMSIQRGKYHNSKSYVKFTYI